MLISKITISKTRHIESIELNINDNLKLCLQQLIRKFLYFFDVGVIYGQNFLKIVESS